MNARCYMEFCCNTATIGVVAADWSGTGQSPILWGWCKQHVPAHVTQPRHRRDVPLAVHADVQNDAWCECGTSTYATAVCPRHKADAYADFRAKHATDSIGPIR